MKNSTALALSCFVLLSTASARAAEETAPAEGKVWTNMGLSLEGPEERLRAGQKANATVENPTTLSQRGVAARLNDKVVLTLTGPGAFTLFHPASGRTFRFRSDAQGNVTLRGEAPAGDERRNAADKKPH